MLRWVGSATCHRRSATATAAWRNLSCSLTVWSRYGRASARRTPSAQSPLLDRFNSAGITAQAISPTGPAGYEVLIDNQCIDFQTGDIELATEGGIERDGDARFQPIGEPGPSTPVRDRLGFRRQIDGDVVYYILPEAWKMIMAGRDPDATARQLLSLGVLLPGESNRTQKKVRVPGLKTTQRVFAVAHSTLFADLDRGTAAC